MLKPSPQGGMGLRVWVELGQHGDHQLCSLLPCDVTPCGVAVILILGVCRRTPHHLKCGRVLLLR